MPTRKGDRLRTIARNLGSCGYLRIGVRSGRVQARGPPLLLPSLGDDNTRSRNQKLIEGSHGASPQTPPGPTRAFARRAEPLDLLTKVTGSKGDALGGSRAKPSPYAGNNSSNACAFARLAGSASRATIRSSTERARGSPCAPRSKANASRLLNHCGSKSRITSGRRFQ